MVGPIFDSLTYGYLSQLFISNLSSPISEAELNLLIIAPTTGPLFIPVFASIFSQLGYSFDHLNNTALIINSVLLAVLFWRLHKCNQLLHLGSLLSLAVFLALWIQDTRWFLFALGDAPALLLTLIAITFALDEELNAFKRHSYFTLFACMAIFTRLTSLPLVVGATAYLFFYSWQNISNTSKIPSITKLAFTTFLVFAACYGFIWIVQYLLLRIDNHELYQAINDAHRIYLDTNNTTRVLQADTLAESLCLTAQSAPKNYILLEQHFKQRLGFNVIPMCFTIVFALIIAVPFCKTWQKHPLAHFFGICCAMALLQATWFFSTAELMHGRYTYQLATALFLACATALIILSRYLFLATSFSLVTAIFLLKPLLMTEIPYTASFKEAALQTQNQLYEIEQLKEFLIQNDLESLSYLKIHGASLALSANFFIPAGKHIQGAEAIINRDITHFGAIDKDYLLVIDRFFWRTMKFKPVNLAFQNRLHRACTKEVFANRSYRVMHCDQQGLNREFPAAEVRSWQLPSYVW